MAAKPVVLPDTLDGEGSWDDWICHFKNVANVNDWDDATKLTFLKVRLVAKAQRAFQHLAEATHSNYARARDSLKARFEPESKKTKFHAKFQCRMKKKNESWADLAKDLCRLTDKDYD